ncbi:hypothetical protein HanRHA438_Chr07g0296941 [Helianthus annuus]|nr:hypothetical protein HanRHA438_Chr07g0296941 [Helianthus annuus]
MTCYFHFMILILVHGKIKYLLSTCIFVSLRNLYFETELCVSVYFNHPYIIYHQLYAEEVLGNWGWGGGGGVKN